MKETITSVLKIHIVEILQEKKREVGIPEIEKELSRRGTPKYTQGVLAGALKQLREAQKIVSTRRGFYSYNAEKNAEYRQEVNISLTERCSRVYEDATQKISDIINSVDIANCSEKEWQEVEKLRVVLKEMKKNVDQMA